MRPPFRLDWIGGRDLARSSSRRRSPSTTSTTRPSREADRRLDERTGARLWTVPVGRCEAAAPGGQPARARNRLRDVPQPPPCGRGAAANRATDEVLAVAAGPSHTSAGPGTSARPRRRRPSSASASTSGRRTGDVYCLDARNGKTIWTYHVGAPVKGAIAYDRGKVFFGAYDGKLYALGAATGKLIWRAPSDRDLFGGHGHFYSTPAVAYSRVYSARPTARLRLRRADRQAALVVRDRLRTSTARRPSGDGRVFVGSYDHTSTPSTPRRGAVRWTFRADGPISGSATVVDGIVYFAHASSAARTGSTRDRPGGLVVARRRLRFRRDRRRLYLVGWGKVYAFSPRRRLRRREFAGHNARACGDDRARVLDGKPSPFRATPCATSRRPLPRPCRRLLPAPRPLAPPRPCARRRPGEPQPRRASVRCAPCSRGAGRRFGPPPPTLLRAAA